MSEDLNKQEGRISGKPQTFGGSTDGKITGKDVPATPPDQQSKASEKSISNGSKTRKERIRTATLEKGLKSLPTTFGDSEGDWQIIQSSDLFEVLYLDHDLVTSIVPDVVSNNFSLIQQFWKEKRNLWESGSGQVRKSVEDKYGSKNLNDCLKKMDYAHGELFTLEKIKAYDEKLTTQRLQLGADKLESLLRLMTKNGEAEPGEIDGIVEEGLKYDLNTEETAVIIKNTLDAKEFKPYGVVSGMLLSEKLRSVSWMSEERLQTALAEAEAKKKAGREIFDNVYAYSVEEIGEIIFNHETEAKRDIADGLLKNSIDYFSPAKARQFIDIIKAQKSEHLRYLQVVYRLKPQLPYRFSSSQFARSPEELCNLMFESTANMKQGIEQFKNGYPEVWLMETNKKAYQVMATIKESAQNRDLAFLEFIYTFSSVLPYRFSGQYLLQTPGELCAAITKDAAGWEAGKKELFDGSMVVWLTTAKKSMAATQWNKVRDSFSQRQDLGLEFFLHLLDNKLEHSILKVAPAVISYPRIQSGQVVQTRLAFTNTTRGCLEANVKLSKPITGVMLSAESFTINNTTGANHFAILLTIDSKVLLKGVTYETTLVITTFEQQKIEIPVSFKIVFPKNAFLLETSKYALVVSVLFVLIRLIIGSQYPLLLSGSFNSFMQWQEAVQFSSSFAVFGWAFLAFAGFLLLGGFYLIKYLRK